MKILVRNQTSGEVLGDRVDCARSSAERRRGLLSRTSLAPGEGLWIDPCEAVHSGFMKFPIDVLHLDRNKIVKKVRHAMKPWRLSFSFTSRSALELPAGAAARTAPGDRLIFTRVAALALFSAALFSSCAAKQVSVAPPISSFDRQIRNAVDAGDGDYQLARLREKVIEAPADLAFRLDLAAAYEAKGYPELALDHYRLAAATSPAAAEPQLRLARTLVFLHHADAAIAGYSAFLTQHPEAAPAYVAWLGILQDEAHLPHEAELSHREALRRAAALHQDADYLHNNLGFSLLTQHRAAEAATEFRFALSLNSHSEIARDNLAAALTDQPAEALVHFQSLSGPAAAHNNLAALLMEQGKLPEAHQELDRALQYDRAYPAALRNLKILADLEGKPAIISVSPEKRELSRYARLKHGVNRFFNGTPPNRNTTGTVQTASRSTEP